jgi:hypothetical protein
MKTSLTILLLFLLQYPLNRLNAQSGQSDNLGLPINPDKSILFGKDIIIHDQPDRNQRNIAVCSAFNGWLYAVYTYNNGVQPYITFLRSTDNGITWNVLGDFTNYFQHYVTTKLNIIACGNSLSTLKIFMAEAVTDTFSFPKWGMELVGRYQGEPFVGEEAILSDGGPITGWNHGIDLASDQNYPANNANPFSIAVAYTKSGDGDKDTLFFYSSSNGGISFDNKRIVALSSHHLEKVALSFGRSLSKPAGMYFVTWEEKNTSNAATGHIYTAHSEPNFDSPFTRPVCLDSLDPAAINKVRNPAISCQVNNLDNDSSNLTQVVLFDKYDPSNLKYDITGYYNLQAANHSNFKKLNISNSAHNSLQSSINFNPFDSTFMVTYYDSTTQKLPFLLNNFNLKNPDTWQFVTTGYNDDGNLSAPYPKIELNLFQKQGANVWSKEGIGGNGIAMFDAPYSTWTGGSNDIEPANLNSYGAYPNPCSTVVTIWFELQKPENITTSLYDISGNWLGIKNSQTYSTGKSFVKFDISTLSPGCYYYSLMSGRYSHSGKIIVIK